MPGAVPVIPACCTPPARTDYRSGRRRMTGQRDGEGDRLMKNGTRVSLGDCKKDVDATKVSNGAGTDAHASRDMAGRTGGRYRAAAKRHAYTGWAGEQNMKDFPLHGEYYNNTSGE